MRHFTTSSEANIVRCPGPSLIIFPNMLIRILIFIYCLNVLTTCRAATFDVYIAAGQSNMDGRGDKGDLVGSLEVYSEPQPGILLYYDNPRDPANDSAKRPTYQSNGWVPLQPGYAIQPGFPNGGTLPGTKFGPEISFGRAISNSTERRVAIIKVSRGGTSLANDWDPSDTPGDEKGYMYRGFETAVPQALQALREQGHSVEVRGVIWHQGSADPPDYYETHHREFIQAVRQELGYPNLPFLIGELAASYGNRPAIRAIQRNVAATTSYAGLIPSDGLELLSDGHHFSASGVIELGLRYATTMQELISNLPGDFNRDGVVDQQDFQVWATFEGSKTDARADANNDGAVDRADLAVWQAAVPEPATGNMALPVAVLCGAYLWSRTRHRARMQPRYTP